VHSYGTRGADAPPVQEDAHVLFAQSPDVRSEAMSNLEQIVTDRAADDRPAEDRTGNRRGAAQAGEVGDQALHQDAEAAEQRAAEAAPEEAARRLRPAMYYGHRRHRYHKRRVAAAGRELRARCSAPATAPQRSCGPPARLSSVLRAPSTGSAAGPVRTDMPIDRRKRSSFRIGSPFPLAKRCGLPAPVPALCRPG